MTKSRRRVAPAVVLTLLALGGCAVAWIASVALRRFDEAQSRAAAAVRPVALEVPAWAPVESFSYDLEEPLTAMRTWLIRLGQSCEERVPEPPAELVAWMGAHAVDVDALARRVRATGPLVLPARTSGVVRLYQRGDPIVAVHRARNLLVASAGVAADRGRHHDAEQHLEAAWSLDRSLARDQGSLPCGTGLLGALRVVRVADPGDWLARLETIDLREEWSDLLGAQARWRVQELKALAESEVPAWLPAPARRVGVRLAEIPPALRWNSWIGGGLDAREALLAQDPCADPAGLISPSRPQLRARPDWLPAPRGERISQELDGASRRMGTLNLTRSVLAARAGLSDDSPCGGPRLRRLRLGDQVAIEVEERPSTTKRIRVATDFTLDVPTVQAPEGGAPDFLSPSP